MTSSSVLVFTRFETRPTSNKPPNETSSLAMARLGVPRPKRSSGATRLMHQTLTACATSVAGMLIATAARTPPPASKTATVASAANRLLTVVARLVRS